MAILFHCPWEDADHWRATLARLTGETMITAADPGAETAEVAIVWKAPRAWFESAPRLRLICSLGAGVDHILHLRDSLPAGVRLSRVVDPVMSNRMAVYALTAVLRYHRHFDRFAAQQRDALWRRHDGLDIGAYRVGVLGQGEIGVTVAGLLAATGFAVSGWAKTSKPGLPWPVFTGPAGLDHLLPTVHAAVLVLPLTADTVGLVDRRFLALLPPGAVLINESRGEHVVDADLIAALDGGRLHGATLDAFAVEPLPADSPLWAHPQVLITPHCAGLSNVATGASAIADEIARFRRGEPLRHEVRLDRGY